MSSSHLESHSSDLCQGFDVLPDASKVSFQDTPPTNLAGHLPNLPPESNISFDGSHFPADEPVDSALDLVHRLLVYPPDRRLNAANAQTHPWFKSVPHLLLPEDFPESHAERNERGSLQEHLIYCLGRPLVDPNTNTLGD